MGVAGLIAYDVDDGSWDSLVESKRDQLRTWLVEHGLDPCNVYRFELHVIDCPLIRVFEFKRSDDGHLLVDESGTEVLRRDPCDVLQKTDPPIQPWGA